MLCLLITSVPLFIALAIIGANWVGFKDQDEDVLKSCLIGLGIIAILIPIIFYATKYSKVWDTEILNGQVVSKSRDVVPCEHSYECNCYTTENCEEDSHGHEDCTEERHCSTCYEHPYDVSWCAQTNLGDICINRLDSQGLEEPPRWDIIKPGDPVAVSKNYVNYILAANYSIFHEKNIISQKMLDAIPNYPEIYDYYNINRVIPIGIKLDNLNYWNKSLSIILEKLGPAKQANIIMVLVKGPDQEWAAAIKNKWMGAKKNDIIITIGVEDDQSISWTNISALTDSQIFKVTLKDDINNIGSIKDPDSLFSIIDKDTNSFFKRKSMKDFLYLKSEIDPSNGVLIFLWILSAGGSLIVLGTFIFINEEEKY